MTRKTQSSQASLATAITPPSDQSTVGPDAPQPADCPNSTSSQPAAVVDPWPSHIVFVAVRVQAPSWFLARDRVQSVFQHVTSPAAVVLQVARNASSLGPWTVENSAEFGDTGR